MSEELFDKVCKVIDEHVDLITITAEGLAEARERAGRFLVAQAMLATYLKSIEEELVKLSSLKDASFAQALKKSDGKNVTEKKINVASDDQYKDANESYEKLVALRDWIKNHMKIFENAHILYRMYCRE